MPLASRHLDTIRSVDLRHDDNGNTQLLTGAEDGLVALWDIDKIARSMTRQEHSQCQLEYIVLFK